MFISIAIIRGPANVTISVRALLSILSDYIITVCSPGLQGTSPTQRQQTTLTELWAEVRVARVSSAKAALARSSQSEDTKYE